MNANIFDLQMFSEEATTESNNDNDINNVPEDKPEQSNAKTYTEDEVNAIITKRLAREKAKQEQALKEAEEAEKFKKMTEQQKLDARMKKLESELEGYKQRENESRMTTVAREAVNDAGIVIPEGILKTLVADKAEDTKANVDGFIKLFNDAVNAQVASKLHKGEPAKRNSGRVGGTLTREQILQIKDTLQRQKMIAENPDLFPEMGL